MQYFTTIYLLLLFRAVRADVFVQTVVKVNSLQRDSNVSDRIHPRGLPATLAGTALTLGREPLDAAMGKVEPFKETQAHNRWASVLNLKAIGAYTLLFAVVLMCPIMRRGACVCPCQAAPDTPRRNCSVRRQAPAPSAQAHLDLLASKRSSVQTEPRQPEVAFGQPICTSPAQEPSGSLAGHRGFAVVVWLSAAIWAVAFFVGMAHPILSASVNEEGLLGSLVNDSQSGKVLRHLPMGWETTSLALQHLGINVKELLVSGMSITIYQFVAFCWRSFFQDGKLHLLLAAILFTFFIIISTVVSMLKLLQCARKLSRGAADETAGTSLTCRITEEDVQTVTRLKDVSLCDWMCAGLAIILACATDVGRSKGIVLEPGNGLFLMICAEVMHLITFHLVRGTAQAELKRRSDIKNADKMNPISSKTKGQPKELTRPKSSPKQHTGHDANPGESARVVEGGTQCYYS
jgi:hypothetical protein